MRKQLDLKQAKRELIAFIGFFYLIPILMLYFGYLPFWSRHVVLALMGFVLTAYAIGRPIGHKELGFRTDNIKRAMIWNTAVTALAIVGVVIAWKTGFLKATYLGGETIWFYLFYVLISAPIQEFVFRSLMFYELNLLLNRSAWFKITFSAFIYSLAHVMYKDPAVLAITFGMGLVWGYIYLKKPNFWGVAISHAILGAVTIFFGFI